MIFDRGELKGTVTKKKTETKECTGMDNQGDVVQTSGEGFDERCHNSFLQKDFTFSLVK